MTQLPGQDGPFRHLIERALNVEEDNMTKLYCVSGKGTEQANLIFSDPQVAEIYAKELGSEVREKIVPTPKVNLIVE